MSPFALAADAIVLIHLIYVSFTVGGTILILILVFIRPEHLKPYEDFTDNGELPS